MGVKGLYTYLKNYRRPKHDYLTGHTLRIGFDAMSMLYNYKSRYEDMYPMLRSFKEAGHRLFFVFDGRSPVEKEAEVKERRDARETATTQASSIKEYLAAGSISLKERNVLEYSLARLESQGWYMTRDIRHNFQKALWDMEIPYVKAIGEADDALSDLVAAGKLDVVVSTDMDFLLSGVPRLWIPFRGCREGFEEVLLQEVLDGEDMTLAMFQDAGILCGIELLRGKLCVPSHMAFSWIRYYKSVEELLESKVEEPQLAVLRDAELVKKARARFSTDAVNWSARIRPDHLERCRAFVEAL